MRLNGIIAGVGMTRFGKHMETGLKALGAEAVKKALADAGIDQSALEAAYVGNAAAGLVTGQESIRGQVVLRSIGIGRIPVINVELTEQLQGRSGDRQVEGAKLALAQNGGGNIGTDAAAMCVTILQA